MKKQKIVSIGIGTVILICILILVMKFTTETEDYKDTLNSSMKELTSEQRGAGFSGEQNQIQKFSERMKGYGYKVELDKFTAKTKTGEDFTSQNIIAKRKADQSNNDANILIITSHIDSIPSTVGANDNASGTAVLEAVAKEVKNIPSDTELWFVVFSGEEEGLKGSSHFVSTITAEEKSRIIGDIQLDMLGHYLSDGYQINTVTGKENDVANFLVEGVQQITGKPIHVTQEKSSDHVSFAIAGIPSVLFTQNGDGFENHEIMDDLSQIDMDKLEESAKIVGAVVQKVMSDKPIHLTSPAEREIAGYLSPYTEVMDVDTSLQGMKNSLGTELKKIETLEDEILGTVSTYQCQMYWLNMEQPLTSKLIFYDDQFQTAEIEASEAGYSVSDMKQLITKIIGEPSISKNEDNLDSYFWEWILGRTAFQIDMKKDGSYALTAMPFSYGTNELYDIKLDENGEPSGKMDAKTQKLWDDIISKVVRKEERASFMDRFVLYTDGVHYQLGFTTPAEPDNVKNSMWLDINDVFDENQEYRHYYKTVSTVIHEFGHVLALNEDQLDVQKNGDDSISLPPYRENSYMSAFMKKFYPDMDVNDSHASEMHAYREHPDEYVSLYATDKTMEDFADSFMCFVLMDKQKETSVARKKINFFYDYPNMVEIRNEIRGNFDWLE